MPRTFGQPPTRHSPARIRLIIRFDQVVVHVARRDQVRLLRRFRNSGLSLLIASLGRHFRMGYFLWPAFGGRLVAVNRFFGAGNCPAGGGRIAAFADASACDSAS